GTKSWSFDWTAPATNIGSVTFYGAFNGSNNNGSSTGDIIYTTTLVVPACLLPATPSLISGNQTPCVSSTPSYSISAVSGATSYNWTIPSGWAGTSTSTFINTTASATSGSITVSSTNACGTSTPQVLSVTAKEITSIGISKTNVTCNSGNNGTASANPVGGTAPYTYSWDTSPIQTSATATGLTAGVYNVTATDATGCSRTMSVTINQPTSLNSTAINTHVLCNGGNTGASTIAGAGGTPPYTYSWNTTPVQTTSTATSLTAGNYMCNIKDANNCTSFGLATINQPTALTGTVTSTNVLCKGGNSGTATALPSGGTSGYTFSWNTSPVQTTATATNLAIGTYTVTITDANNCTTTAQTTITEPTAILNATSNVIANVLCNGNSTGSASLAGNGGTTSYSYSWNTSPVQSTITASNLAAGTYIGTVTDANGCTDTSHVTIKQPTVLLPNITPSPAYCQGSATGTAAAENPGGTPPYIYSWNSSPVQTTSFASGLVAGNYILTITDSNNCVATVSTIITEPTALSVSAIQTNVLCKGGNTGTATATVNGGAGSYSYSWNTTPVQTTTTAINLLAGAYTVTATDINNCTITTSITITEPTTTISVSTTTTNSACANPTGTATATATGGSGTLSYSWNTSPVQTVANATNIASGTYTVTVTDANGCVNTAMGTITNPSGATASITSITNVLCNGGTTGAATASATGGLAPYTYSWNTLPTSTATSLTNLVAGSYTVTVTDANNCVTTAIATITQTAIISGTITKANVLCSGMNTGSGTITGTGGTSPYTYSWNTSPVQTTTTASNLFAGGYVCTVTDVNNCVGTKTVSITQSTMLAITKTKTEPSCGVCVDGAAGVIVSGGSAPYMYSWNTLPVQTTASITGVGVGKYIVTITDANGCVKKDSITLSIITGIAQQTTQNTTYSIYPNPVTHALNVAVTLPQASTTQLYITNVVGEQLITYMQASTTTFTKIIDVTNLAAGVYFVVIHTNNETITKRFVKE
ncbi:MAG: T9SS type A sorting domain-containing protein, partial [Bacteroidia bacterium]|nr:T9SS type A sorting domain-containing protein [Bacteroidia bacterium]